MKVGRHTSGTQLSTSEGFNGFAFNPKAKMLLARPRTPTRLATDEGHFEDTERHLPCSAAAGPTFAVDRAHTGPLYPLLPTTL